MKKNVIFDYGNVVIQWRPFLALSHLFETEADMLAVFDKTGFADWNAEQDRGRSWADGLTAMRAAHPAHLHVYEAYVAGLVPAHSTLVEGTSEIIERLHQNNVGLYGLTNAAPESFAAVQAVCPAIRLMKDTVVSGEHNLIKPDAKIFELCLSRNNLAREDCVFVDDSAVNCDGARAVGIDAIQFLNASDLEQQLVARGLL